MAGALICGDSIRSPALRHEILLAVLDAFRRRSKSESALTR